MYKSIGELTIFVQALCISALICDMYSQVLSLFTANQCEMLIKTQYM